MARIPPPSNHPIKVFIADDSLVVREHLIRMLDELAGVEIVGHAEHVAQAISAIQDRQPDVVILDIRMSGGSGIDVLRHIKQDGARPNLLQRMLMGLGDLFNHYWTTYRFSKGSPRQFKIGDLVVHPTYGAGQIVNLENKQFSGKRAPSVL